MEEPGTAEPGRLSARPCSVYRLQLNGTFTFRDATRVLPYLRRLGVDAVYCSPYLQAVPGSMHGYDVTDPARVNPEIGSPADFEAFCAALRDNGMAQIIDVVPNHMGVTGNTNAWWMDVLENGPASVHADFFDIDWNPVKRELRNKILLPVLGDYYGAELEGGQIRLEYDDGQFRFRYHEHLFPVAPDTYHAILPADADALAAEPGADASLSDEYRNLLARLQSLPPRSDSRPSHRARRHEAKEEAKRRLAGLCAKSSVLRRSIDEQTRIINGQAGVPRSFDMLDALLNEQSYRLAFWGVAGEEINYRRFFDIKDLAALRMHTPEVFRTYHQLIFDLIRSGCVHGLRVDHPDGLYDPAAYFEALQSAYRAVTDGNPKRELFVIVEKILGRDEPLPDDWAVHGTVGYDFLGQLNGLFVQAENEKPLTDVYEAFVGQGLDFHELLYRAKRFFCTERMPSDVTSLGHRLDLLSEKNRRFRDFTRNDLTRSIRETIACFPVYRTYATPRSYTLSERDRTYVSEAIRRARPRAAHIHPAVFDFLENILLMRFDPTIRRGEREAYRDFVLRFQQLTGPIMAKGLEDTSFYIFNRLLSLNEVGGNPHHFGTSVEEFHRANSERRARWPLAFLATSTHDSKRSEDVRYRINTLSEMPEEWNRRLAVWSTLTGHRKVRVNGAPCPEPNTEYFIYQTLLGAWPDEDVADEAMPAFRDRIWSYVEKSVREANVHTGWLVPDEAYESAVRAFLDSILSDSASGGFLADFRAFQRRIATLGHWNAVAATALKIGAPGVVDTYQGSELSNYALVDPDNRRPVDYGLRERRLAEVAEMPIEDIVQQRASGALKLFLLARGLGFRCRHADLFIDGDYTPLSARGPRERHVVAFARRLGPSNVLVAAGRFFATLLPDDRAVPAGADVWGDTRVELPDGLSGGGAWTDIFTGDAVAEDRGSVPVSALFGRLPAAMLFNRKESL
jgi:(1->4)-alpha-D-glucan 1-alpha-D-glucosylmutase